jgi:hypothetical protein
MNQVRVTREPPPPIDHGAKQAAAPLTHHQILALMGPFARRERHLDLTASRREERKLAFKARELPAPAEGLPPLREELLLEVPERGSYRLTRTLTSGTGQGPVPGLTATLSASGPDLEVLLEQIERVAPQRHFRICGGVPLALSFRLKEDPRAGPGMDSWSPALTQARARLADVALEVECDTDPALAMPVRLRPVPGQRLQIPEDLIAVIGGGWRPLEELSTYWRGGLKVRAKGPERAGAIEEQLCRGVTHLADVLESEPQHFHERFRSRRWRVALMRAVPLLTALGIIAATPAVTLLPMGEGSVLRMLIFHAPPLMLIAFFVFRELPRIEIPPLPRPLRNTTWLLTRAR